MNHARCALPTSLVALVEQGCRLQTFLKFFSKQTRARTDDRVSVCPAPCVYGAACCARPRCGCDSAPTNGDLDWEAPALRPRGRPHPQAAALTRSGPCVFRPPTHHTSTHWLKTSPTPRSRHKDAPFPPYPEGEQRVFSSWLPRGYGIKASSDNHRER